MLLRILNPIQSKLVVGDKNILLPTMSYPSHVYHRVMNEEKGYREKKRCEFNAGVIDKDGFFLTGFIPRLSGFCAQANIPLEIECIETPGWFGKLPDISLDRKKEIARKLREDGPFPIVLRNDQKDVIRKIHWNGRGVIVSPTGSGKTVMMLATVLFHHDHLNFLILVPNTDLVKQGVEDFKPYFKEGEIGFISGTKIEPGRITFANIQKFHKLPSSEWHDNIDVVIVDECHHVNKFRGTYAQVLKSIPAFMRLGFTATPPYEPEGVMALEGLIGPTIGKVEMETLIEEGVLAKPIIRIKKVPYNHRIHELEVFADVYAEGVVHNRIRNRMILQDAQELVKTNLTTLVLVKQIEHGENLERMAKVMFPDIKLRYIHGDTDKAVRERVRQTLTRKDLDVVIASVIWKEGINIPSLGGVINAAGGKFEIFPQQALGRGLRVAPGKTEVFLYDYFDPSHPYLIDHFGYRLTLYFDLGWL